jgi:hypothetical protein
MRVDRDDDDVRVSQCLGAVLGGDDFGRVVPPVDGLLHRPPGEIEPLGVDVHQAERGVFGRRKCEDVARQVAGEDRAARADKGNFGHERLLVGKL